MYDENEKTKRHVQLNFKLPLGEKKLLMAACERKNISVTKLIRKLIKEYSDNN